MTSPVVIVGDINVDIAAHITHAIELNSDTPSTNQLSLGGSPTNVAAWLTRSGETPDLWGAIGDDALGDWVSSELTARGVPTTHVARMKQQRTGTCIVIVEANGNRTMFPDPAANLSLSVTPEMQNAITDARFVVMSAYSFMRSETQQLATDVLRITQDNQVKLIIDAASRAPIVERGVQAVAEYLSAAWLIIANEEEAAVLADVPGFFASRERLIVKRGVAGSEWQSHGQTLVHVAGATSAPRDTTGAGDAFLAGVVRALVERGAAFDESDPAELRYVLEQATAVAGVCCMTLGASPAL